VTGFGLVQGLAGLDIPVLPIGDSVARQWANRAWLQVWRAGALGSSAGRRAAGVCGLLGVPLGGGAIFTAPDHPLRGGTALIGSGGDLLGIGSLQLQHTTPAGGTLPLNMIVPIDLLTPILDA